MCLMEVFFSSVLLLLRFLFMVFNQISRLGSGVFGFLNFWGFSGGGVSDFGLLVAFGRDVGAFLLLTLGRFVTLWLAWRDEREYWGYSGVFGGTRGTTEGIGEFFSGRIQSAGLLVWERD